MKTKSLLAFLLAGTALAGAFVSCDDDDDEGGSGKVSTKSFYDIDGQRVKSVGSMFRCSYDDEGNLFSYYMWGDSYDLSLKPFKLSSDDEDCHHNYNITLNGNGLISTVKYKHTHDDEDYNSNATFNISYNGNGQISSISYNGSGQESDDGETYKWTENGNATFSYSGSVLKKISLKYSWKENGKTESETETVTFVYNSDYENVFNMYTPNYAEVILDDMEDLKGLAFIGMFGKASSMLPDAIEWEWTDEDGEDGTEYDYCSYTFKANGSIKSADGYDYTYTTVDTRAIVEDEPTEYVTVKTEKKHRGIFSKMMHHHGRKQ